MDIRAGLLDFVKSGKWYYASDAIDSSWEVFLDS
jgi:hypothetical protein